MTATSFHHDIRQWRTAAEFKTHLKQHDPGIADWAKGIVIHHSVSPTPNTWQGMTTMQSMMMNFISRGWDSGPHLFIVQDSRKADWNGIWQMTPLNLPGTHARQCNSSTWGIEVVGNYTTARWNASTTQMVLLAVAALMRWRKLEIDATTLKGHRDCNQTECPGAMIQMPAVRTAAIELMENYAY